MVLVPLRVVALGGSGGDVTEGPTITQSAHVSGYGVRTPTPDPVEDTDRGVGTRRRRKMFITYGKRYRRCYVLFDFFVGPTLLSDTTTRLRFWTFVSSLSLVSNRKTL